MDYEEMIEDANDPIEPKPEAGLDEEIVEVTEDPRPKSPWKAFILTGLIASLIGAVGGGYGIYEGVKRFAPTAELQPAVDVTPIQTKLDALTKRVSAAEASAKKTALKAEPVDLSGLEARLTELEVEGAPVDLSGLEARLNELEAAPAPDIDPTALKALQSAQKDGFEWPDTSDLEDRLSALQVRVETAPEPTEMPGNLLKRLKALEAQAEEQAKAESRPATGAAAVTSQMSAIEKKRRGEIEARLTALESRSAAAPRVERVAILPFPKTAMMKAVEETKEGGMMKKILSKHIRVKDDDDPATLIDQMEADMKQGRLPEALQKYDRLPDPVRAAGQAWHNSVKASL